MLVENRLNPWLTGLSLLICVYFLVLLPLELIQSLVNQPPWLLVDFDVFYVAGKKAFLHHTVYDVQTSWQFKYSPLIAYGLGAFFGSMSHSQAQLVYTLASCLFWPVLLTGVITYFSSQTEHTFGSVVKKLGLILFFYGNSYILELKLGQINALPFALLFLFFLIYESTLEPEPRKQNWVKLLVLSILWSLAIQIKLYSAVIGAYLLFRKEFKLIILTALMTFVLDFVLLSHFQGWSFAVRENLDWIRTLIHSTGDLLAFDRNSGLWGLMTRIPGIKSVVAPIWGLLLATFLVIQYRIKDQAPKSQLILNLLVILLLTPLVWSNWSLIAIPAVLVLYPLALPSRPQPCRWTQVALVFVLLNQLGAFSWVSRSYLNPIAHLLLALAWLKNQRNLRSDAPLTPEPLNAYLR